MKTLLHMIVSGKELNVTSVYSIRSGTDDSKKTEMERKFLKDELKVFEKSFKID